MYVSRGRAAKHFSVSGQTIVKWADCGTLDFVRQPSGQRRYWIGETRGATKEKKNICYCRVSSAGQKDDLHRQIEYMRSKYPGWEIVSDIGSGLNWKRKGLKTILRRALQGDVAKIAVAHKDRLARFGFDIIEFMLAQRGVGIICDSNDEHKSREEELTEDIISIITVFSAKIYGRRKYRKRNDDQGEAHTDSSNEGPTESS
jgi:predicted site-specific integrase-resolvase